jgi:hypothetical protein
LLYQKVFTLDIQNLYFIWIDGQAKKGQKKKAEKFLQKDHTDSNMLVAIRIRPLSQKEIAV